MRRGVRFPAWYLLLVAVLGILSRCQSLQDLERFAIRYQAVLTAALDLELRVFQAKTQIRAWLVMPHPPRAEEPDALYLRGLCREHGQEPVLRLLGKA